ncbi:MULTISPECIES: molybdopterin converting factor subunit 1 [Rhizobium]|jgi:molybdopterin synthase sulfur carrier subunit|uniref:Molybdopterin synthase sulfur carrier subunit n=1 Tax=Rhizobium altiplani TaxID=1864509 RepID=A0A120FR22_9HYPH|nr:MULTISPECIES: molybdopterin converting factor subunit 1 [Rhizobium]KWV59435.1 molybdopterin synthase sulfur carrier subunit [Rhizobium altiplani]MBD9448660.1 molybdopterin converting factor subunit 1 [Rhizobium sp. RHZ01]MBD9451973.1 molybdopterin converting factor subunit 1 [Rhizobium sp. RHZ02]NMN70018.1 molybdopterin synthase sulfur carrier subunit [Rhizobium sp. 57MFTsu3.2]
MTKLVYFAWVRERIGKAEEEMTLPSSVVSVADLLNHLKTMGEEYETALQFPDVIRVAVDQEHVEHDEPIGNAREIGIFPPMTGG